MQRRITRSKVVSCLFKEMNAIKVLYPNVVEDVGFSNKTLNNRPLYCGNGFATDAYGDTDGFYVAIGVYGFPSKRHMFVDMSLFCEMMLAVKHEQEHIRQQAVIYQKNTPENVNMAKDYVSTFYNPRYYKYNYGNLLHEIDANIQAIKDTRTYFRENFPEYDVDADLCKIMYNRQSSSPYGWFTTEHKYFDSVDAMLSSMIQHKDYAANRRSLFIYPRRDADEQMDYLEKYLSESPRSVRLAWGDMCGLEQRDHIVKIIMDAYPDDVRSIPILSSKNVISYYPDDLIIDEHGGINYERE